jgi:hypothetical protein
MGGGADFCIANNTLQAQEQVKEQESADVEQLKDASVI